LDAAKMSCKIDQADVFSESSAEDSASDEEISDTVNESSYSQTSDFEVAETENTTTDGSSLNVTPCINDIEFSDDDTDTETDSASHMTRSGKIPYRSMQCMAHTLQLVVEQVHQIQYADVIPKARNTCFKSL
jgi:hypothetical protein